MGCYSSCIKQLRQESKITTQVSHVTDAVLNFVICLYVCTCICVRVCVLGICFPRYPFMLQLCGLLLQFAPGYQVSVQHNTKVGLLGIEPGHFTNFIQMPRITEPICLVYQQRDVVFGSTISISET